MGSPAFSASSRSSRYPNLRLVLVSGVQGVGPVGLVEIGSRERVLQPAVVRLAGELEHPQGHHDGDPVSGELFHERVHHFSAGSPGTGRPLPGAGLRSPAPADGSCAGLPAVPQLPWRWCRACCRPRSLPDASSSSSKTLRCRSPGRSGAAEYRARGSGTRGRGHRGTLGGRGRAWCTSFPVVCEHHRSMSPLRAPVPRRSATGCRFRPVGRFLGRTFLAQPAWRLAGTCVTRSIRNMKSLGGLTDAGLTDLDRALRHERLRRREAWRDCEHCGEAFLGRGDARFCTTRCRVAAYRAKKDSNE